MVVPATALALILDELSAVDAAPLLCAGVTTYNALRESGARPSDLVAILGIGGLGHLGVQFAAKMGFRTIATARTRPDIARQSPTRPLPQPMSTNSSSDWRQSRSNTSRIRSCRMVA